MAMIYPSYEECGADTPCKFYDTQKQDGFTESVCNVVNRQLDMLRECPWEKYKLNPMYSLMKHKVECYDQNYTICVDLKELD